MWEIIETLMKQQKMNVYTLASRAQIPPTTIYSWKAGKASPTAEKLAKIAEVLGVTSEYLLGKQQNTYTIHGLKQEEIQKATIIYKQLMQLRPEQRAVVENMINFMLSQNSIPLK